MVLILFQLNGENRVDVTEVEDPTEDVFLRR